ncbi:MAG: cytochrome c-type biogenesis protein CcmH [Enterobacterales bacterium endosymbiont of Blomia tropicalis]|uniref:cytochrome c-type biogenesis protein n=1 Tax=Mixta mediterraneensis TaxID=2758443 RepID=UPI0025A6EB16|nr:cytochrome c-type biogenesis protein [Mixta mediterraneensis]MDL4915400.1 cytochrome c-type biogenesis protein CcmH [Mixta mediterraneensis]
MTRLILCICGMLFSVSLWAAIDTYQFDSVAQEEQYRNLTASLRCPKCQNNSIADSNAMIAADMRLKVYELMKQGQSRQQIINYMVARYGNFVTYEQPVTPSTLILWVGPALFVVLGGLIIILRSRQRKTRSELDDSEQQRLDAILKSDRKP